MKRTVASILCALVFVVACVAPDNPQANTNLVRVNTLRAAYGVAALPRVYELDIKAQAWAQVIANDGYLHHSNLSEGVSPGWRLIGENTAVGGSVEAAQAALENSAGHLTNLVNPAFNQIGIGVVSQGGAVWLVQVFFSR